MTWQCCSPNSDGHSMKELRILRFYLPTFESQMEKSSNSGTFSFDRTVESFRNLLRSEHEKLIFQSCHNGLTNNPRSRICPSVLDCGWQWQNDNPSVIHDWQSVFLSFLQTNQKKYRFINIEDLSICVSLWERIIFL